MQSKEGVAGAADADRHRKPRHSAEQRLQLLQRFARIAAEEQTLDDLLWHLAENIGELFGFDDCVIYLREGSVLLQKAAYGIKHAGQRAILSPISLTVGDGIVGTVAKTGKPEFVRNLAEDPRYISDQVNGVAELTVPIVFQGEVIGVLDSEANHFGVFQEGDLELFQAVADVAAARIAWLTSERGQIRQRQEHREKQIEGIGRLGANLAHEINNSLAVVSLHAELLRAGCEPSMDSMEDLESLTAIEHAVGRISTLVRRLQTFAVGGEPHRKPVDLKQVLSEAMSALDDYPELESSLQVLGPLPDVLGDANQLEQALEHLLMNAAQATQARGTVEVQVGSVRVRDAGEPRQVFVLISDDGPGLSAEAREHLFDPFYSSRGPGRGLGLATAYRVVTRHDGSIELLDSLEGATFEVRLPAAPTATRNEAESVPTRPLRLLVLDDEAGLRRVLERLLRHLGHEVHAVADGSEVTPAWIEAMERGEPFDLALLDLSVPAGVGGLEALRRLRVEVSARGSADPEADAPAIVMSGYSDDPALARPREFGFCARLEKPFDLASLKAALNRGSCED